MSEVHTPMLLTIRDILQLNHVRTLDADPDAADPITGVSTDSRTTQRGDVYVPLRGTTFDGHDFITEAIRRGARLILADRAWAERNPTLLTSLPVGRIVVEDTLRAFGQLALLCRRKVDIPVIAVAGSNGKTTTKEMIARVLSQRYAVLSTEGNLNNNIGVPKTLLRLDKRHQCAVVEIGTNHFGELTSLCEILEPTHGLITNIGREHLEFFKNHAGVARAEGELFQWLRTHRRATATIFLNKDERSLTSVSRGVRNVISYGYAARAVNVRGAITATTPLGTHRMKISPRGKRSFEVALSVPGHHNALNALAAATVGLAFRVPPPAIAASLADFSPSSKRMETLEINGVLILNDCYNSNPDSAAAALKTLASMSTAGKKIAVLADMLELGTAAETEHSRIGKLVKAAGVEYLLTYGPLSRLTHESAGSPFKAHYEQKNMLAEYLAELVTGGDVVLIKGSRGMKMEDVTVFLRERLEHSAAQAATR